MAASVLEAKALLGSAEAASGIVRSRPPLTIRNPDQARKLARFDEYATLNDAQWARCLEEFAVFARKGRVEADRPWFITQQDAKPYLAPRKPRKQHQQAPLGAGPGPLKRSDSVVSSQGPGVADDVAPMELDGESEALDIASVRTASRATTNRWREREHLLHDYAEYRSCCGQAVKWIPQFKATGTMEEHCSHSVYAFFKSRLKHRAEFTDKTTYDNTVERELVLGQPRWEGYDVCCSCFRAALGIGRAAIFRSKPAGDALEAAPRLTKSGTLKKKRKAVQRDRAADLLRSFSKSYGQIAPNPPNADPTRLRRVLPQKTMQELVTALLAYDQQGRNLESPEPLTLSAIYRGIDWLETYANLYISLGKGNSLCRCAVCDKLDNQCTPAYIKEHKLLQKDVLRFKAQKLSHLGQMREQREYFDAHKEKAMKQPQAEFCITLDGMDQSKTQLPHRARPSKDLEPQPRIKLHWIGAFCFGGPDPVLGLMNTPELRKDAALSIVTLERILDAQWLELERLHRAGVRVAATSSRAASQASEELENKMEEELEHGDAFTLDSSAAVYSGPGMKWPRRLHLTFDNASGECKNQWMMRFLGLLVFHGVFEAITVSMLLVGHTHDIVDQMFSVWSRMLRIYNAETYEKMKALFRERYHSRIDGLVELMRGRQEAYDALTKEEQEAYDAEIKEAGLEWNKEQADILADFSAFVKKHNLLRPHIVQQTVTIDVEGWLRQAVAAKRPPTLKGIPKAYNFGVEKDAAGNVYLYNSQFAKSGDVNTGPVVNSFPAQVTGNWTTRAILYQASDPGLLTDPYRMPPLAIDLAPLRATVLKYGEHKAMNAKEQQEFHGMLDRLEEDQAKQQADCPDCYNALTSFGRHGVVSQRARATDEEKEQATKKLSARSKAWTALQTHIRDPAFAPVHQAKMVHTGFWTKWLQRQREHIQPAYVERGYVFNPTDLAEPYHPPETELCSGVGEPPVHSDRAARVDLFYLHRHGVPTVGQVAIQRTGVSREPFYVCKIRATRPSQKLQSRQLEAARQAEQERCSRGAAAAAAAAEPTAEDEVPERGHAQVPRLKDLEFQVVYYDLCPEDFEQLHLSSENDAAAKRAADNKWWKTQFSQQQQTEAELEAAMHDATANRKPAPARPSWLVNLYSAARFLFDDRPVAASDDWISGATLIAWGADAELLKTASKSGRHPTWQLKAPVWRQLLEDLTERKQDTACDAPSATAKHKTQARSRKTMQDDDSESDEGVDEGAAAAAAAASSAAQARPRLSRAAHAIAPIVELSDDDDEGHEDEEEESSAANEPDADMFSVDSEDLTPLTTLPQANQQITLESNNDSKQRKRNKPAQTGRSQKRKRNTSHAAAASAAAPSTRRRVSVKTKKKA